MNKILYIEDELLMQSIVSKILLREGYDVDVANDGKDALQILIDNKYNYDLVITDIMMPYTNGFEIISKIRNYNSPKKVPIIVISSIGNEDAILEAFKLGADDFLKKPIMAGELLIRVKRLLSL
jgi:DNA-binding response OmpR family regulator